MLLTVFQFVFIFMAVIIYIAVPIYGWLVNGVYHISFSKNGVIDFLKLVSFSTFAIAAIFGLNYVFSSCRKD
jgi:hypothetical protein